MNAFPWHNPERLATCICMECTLVRSGVVDADWEGWSWSWLAGKAIVIMVDLTQQEPVRWWGPRTRWAGCSDWFRIMGAALDFSNAEGDADEPA
jgi:hypothetical protein